MRTTMLQLPCAAVLAIAACDAAHAHNLFVLVEPNADGPDRVDVIFEHSPYPGKGTYNQPHLDRGKTWVQQLSSDKEISLELKKATRLGKEFLQTVTDAPEPRAIVHSCKWGIYNGRLDYFHGKYLDVSSAEQVKALSRTRQLPLDLVPTIEPDGLSVAVLFEGKPLSGIKVSIWAPGGKESKQTADAAGVIRLDSLRPGTYSFATAHTQTDLTGEFNGEPYKGVMHGTSCSLRWPVK